MVFGDVVTDSPGAGDPRSRKGILHPPIFRLAIVPVLALVLLAMFLPRDAAHAATESSADAKASDTWLGGVQYSHVFHKWQTAWDFFNAGEPTAAGKSQLIRDCEAMGGNYVTKAGTGSIGGTGRGYTTTVFDYSCWARATN